jgi:RNA recognition motif-containing protein
MSKKIYVGNLPFQTTEEALRKLFAQHGDVHSVSVVIDRDTGRSRGFGFVEMEATAAGKAIAALDQTELDGRSLRVNEAKPRERDGGGRRDRDGDRGSRW